MIRAVYTYNFLEILLLNLSSKSHQVWMTKELAIFRVTDLLKITSWFFKKLLTSKLSELNEFEKSIIKKNTLQTLKMATLRHLRHRKSDILSTLVIFFELVIPLSYFRFSYIESLHFRIIGQGFPITPNFTS